MKLKNIVVATDFSEASEPALRMAMNLTLETGAVLYLVHVVEAPAVASHPMVPVALPIDELYRHATRQLSEQIPDDFTDQVKIETVALSGAPADELAEFARSKNADLIVVGTHGRSGLSRLLMGSTAEALLRRAPCQVLVVKPRAESTVPA